MEFKKGAVLYKELILTVSVVSVCEGVSRCNWDGRDEKARRGEVRGGKEGVFDVIQVNKTSSE